jgi:hypothetical protein
MVQQVTLPSFIPDHTQSQQDKMSSIIHIKKI